MFGKKKPTAILVNKDFHCSACGLDCKDQNNLERHFSWAHKDLPVPTKSETSQP